MIENWAGLIVLLGAECRVILRVLGVVLCFEYVS